MVDVGDTAPDFTLTDQDRNPVSLKDFRGKAVVLVFYPLSFTGICQGELCEIRDRIVDFSGERVQTLAISCDSSAAHKAWADQQGYTFPLLADFWPHGEVARSYGVLQEEIGLALRGTFVIDAEGVVRHKVVNAIPDARDAQEIVDVLASL